MRLLVIGTDRELFDPDSAVRKRMLEQATITPEMHVIVLTPVGKQYKTEKLSKHLTIHPTNSQNKWTYLLDAFAVASKILKKELAKGKWVVTTQDPFELGVLGYILSKKFHIPLHLQLHTDPFSKEWQSEKFTNRLRYLMMHFLLTRASGIRVVSERGYDAVCALGVPPERVTKIPIFVDTAYFAATPATFDLHRSYPQFSRIILSIGRLQPEKNYHVLIRAFARVHREVSESALLIVGSGPERDRLMSLVRSLDLSESVKILPWARDVISYYKTCDVYVQPSLYEGWGLAVIEAMASSAPVVMTDVGCAGEIVRNEETGIVVQSHDDEAIARGILRLFHSDTLRAGVAVAGKEEVSKLPSKEATLELYKKSLERVLKKLPK